MVEDVIGLAVITRSVISTNPYLQFLMNAQRFGHHISFLIIVYRSSCDLDVVKTLQKYCQVICLKKGESSQLENELTILGLNVSEIEQILGTPYLAEYNCVSYGTSRNYAMVQAMLLKIDFLFFFDTDVYPKILCDFRDGAGDFKEIDFIGNHLKYLRTNNDIIVTTSDYSGYYIIPKMNFPYLHDLLLGVQKEDRYYYITSVDSPVTRPLINLNICNTHKVLGGNMAIDLRKKNLLPPFYSSMMVFEGNCYLGRGEDTLFAPIIESCGGRCVDIDLLIFHNCFGDFPKKPDIAHKKNRDRFFLACLGWIIRNPFLNWIRKEYYHNVNKVTYNTRLDALTLGAKSAAKYFNDERFLILPEAFNTSLRNLPVEIKRFQKLLVAWNKLKLLLNFAHTSEMNINKPIS